MPDEYTVDNLDVLAPSEAERPLLDEQQKPLAVLGAKRAFTIFISFHLVELLVAIPFGVAAGIRAADAGDASGGSHAFLESPVTVVMTLVATVFAGFVALRMARGTLPGSIGSGALATIGWSRASKSQLAIAAAVGATIALFYLVVLLRHFPPAPGQTAGSFTSAIKSGGWPVHIWALLAIVSAPIEEFVHRGVLFSGLSRSWGTLWSGLFVTVVFVLGHLFETRTYWPALLSVTLAATAFLILRIKTKSFIPSVICHAAYNAVIVAAVYRMT
jgi:membrane protease YdiL (CAAX protease family)